jgi:hypothetical protein
VKSKTLWKDIKLPLRRPNPTWKLANAARWFERLLGIAAGSVVFLRPGGERAKPDETIGSLQPKNKAGLAPQK